MYLLSIQISIDWQSLYLIHWIYILEKMIGFVKKLLFDHDTFYKYGTPLILLGELVLCSLIVLNVACKLL